MKEEVLIPRSSISKEEVPETMTVTLWIAVVFVVILCIIWCVWLGFNNYVKTSRESHSALRVPKKKQDDVKTYQHDDEEDRFEPQVSAQDEMRRISDEIDSSMSDEFDFENTPPKISTSSFDRED